MTRPADNTGVWTSINGNLQAHEQHSMAFDPVAGIHLAGTQDNGVAQQAPQMPFRGCRRYSATAAMSQSMRAASPFTGVGLSTRYTSSQFLASFNSAQWNASNELQSSIFLPLTPVDGTPGPLNTADFYTAIRTNAVEDGPSRCVRIRRGLRSLSTAALRPARLPRDLRGGLRA